jgi:hypothetical protein
MGLGLARRTSRSAASRPDASRAATCPVPLRRVEWVRITVEGRSVRAEAVGVGYRLPASCRISMMMAADLTGQGVPFSVHAVGEVDDRTAPTATGRDADVDR